MNNQTANFKYVVTLHDGSYQLPLEIANSLKEVIDTFGNIKNWQDMGFADDNLYSIMRIACNAIATKNDSALSQSTLYYMNRMTANEIIDEILTSSDYENEILYGTEI